MHDDGYELRTAIDDRADGSSPRATSPPVHRHARGCGRPAPSNHSHANQVSLTAWVFEDGLGRRSTTPATPTAASASTRRSTGFDFVALTPIAAGDEITFDYAMRNYVIEHFPASCLCGAATAAAPSPAGRTWRPTQAAYGDLVAPYLREPTAPAPVTCRLPGSNVPRPDGRGRGAQPRVATVWAACVERTLPVTARAGSPRGRARRAGPSGVATTLAVRLTSRSTRSRRR